MPWPFSRKIKNGIPATAHVTACGGVPPSMQASINIGSVYTCPMDLIVQVGDREPYGVSHEQNIDPNRPLVPGMDIPIVVDPDDPNHVWIDKKSIPSTKEKTAAAQESAVAEAQEQWRREHGA
jgi:hypothetical protein